MFSCLIRVSLDGRRIITITGASKNLHPPDGSLSLVLIQTVVEVFPPLEESALADELEPGGESEGIVFEHGLELRLGDVFGGLDFVGVGVEVNVGLDEEDIVD